MIVLDGPVADPGVPESIWLHEVEAALNSQTGPDVLVLVSSRGGSAAQGLAIYATLRSCQHRVVTRIRGYAGSAGAVIAMAGHRVEMESDALLMIHGVSAFVSGQQAELLRAAVSLDADNALIAAVLSERTGRTTAVELMRLHQRVDWWMTADEALAEGYIDAVVPREATPCR